MTEMCLRNNGLTGQGHLQSVGKMSVNPRRTTMEQKRFSQKCILSPFRLENPLVFFLAPNVKPRYVTLVLDFFSISGKDEKYFPHSAIILFINCL